MIKFKTLIPELIQTMPIIRANKINYAWYKRALEDLKSTKFPTATAKCPGIIAANARGWVQRTYQAIKITTKAGDLTYFNWGLEIDQKKLPLGNYMGNYIEWHTGDQLKKYKDFPPNTLHTILKINSPWMVEIPTGYSLLSIPIPYNDDIRFTAATGILKGPNWLNVQIFWHCLDGEEIIPAGTPIQQYILLRDEVVEEALEVVTTSEEFLAVGLPHWTADGWQPER